MLVVCDVATNCAKADYREHCLTDLEFRAIAMMQRASGLIRADVRLSMSACIYASTLTYSIFQAMLQLHCMCVTF